MQYVLLIYQDDAEWEKLTDQEKAAIFPAYGQFYRGIRESGQFRAGNELKATSSATTLRIRADKRLVTDGPFAETKEQLVGFFVVEAKDLDEALSIAARIPSARWGAIEVRPTVTHGPS
jgi:hypothetical protein